MLGEKQGTETKLDPNAIFSKFGGGQQRYGAVSYDSLRPSLYLLRSALCSTLMLKVQYQATLR